MVIPTRARYLVFALIALGCLAGSPRAVAQTSYELSRERHIERVNGAKQTAPLSVDEAFGDQQSLYDGTVTFSNVDISIPGHHGLPVELRRTYSVVDRRETSGDLKPVGQFGAMGDWSLDLPNLHSTFAEGTGWRVKVGANDSTSARCSTQGPPPPVNSWSDYEYWDGYSLHIPGDGDQQLLMNNIAGTPKPTDGATYPWVTKSFWMIGCKATTANGYPGEAFVATSPNGVKYTFDYVVSKETADLKKPAPSLPTTVGLSRVAVYFLATKIEDRFGNWVSFTYSGSKLSKVTSSDGRTITITSYSGDNVSIVDSDAGRWQYGYANGRLKTVTRPDGTTWEYASSGVLRIEMEAEANGNNPADECAAPNVIPSTFTYTVTTPTRALGTFTFTPLRHWRQFAPRNCVRTYPGNPAYLRTPLYHDVFSLTRKLVTGPSLAPMQWKYAYGNGLGTGSPAGYGETCEIQPSDCPTTRFTTIDGPDSKQRLKFGIVYEGNEGQLLEKGEGWSDTGTLRSTRYTYVASDSPWSYPFVSAVGTDPRFVLADRLTSAWLRPVLKTAITMSDDNGIVLDQYTTGVNTFDNFARPLSVTRALVGGASRTDVTAYYDHLSKWVLGQIRSVTNADTGKVSEKIDYYPSLALPQNLYAFGLLKETRDYTNWGVLTSVKDGLLRETKLQSWYRGIPRTIIFADASQIAVGVDVAGNVTSVTNEKLDTTSYGYDPMGRMQSVTYPTDPNSWSVESTTRQFLTAPELGMPVDTWRVQLSIGGHRVRTYYDALMRPVLTEDKDEGAGTATYSRAFFDSRGLTTFKSYPSAVSTTTAGIETTYDALGRVRETRTTDGVLLGDVQYRSGNRLETHDARGFGTTTTYQAFGEPAYELPTRIEAPQTQVTVINRDVFGKMTTVTQSGDLASVTRTLSYDANERLCKRQDPESGATLIGYDAASQVAWEAKGQTATACTTTKPASATQFVYWPRGWTKTVDYADTTGDVSYTYEANGNLKTVKNPTATWTYAWNKRGLLESESVLIDGLTFAIDPEYNSRGDLKSLGYPGGRVVSFAPDASGRSTQLGNWIRSVKYHPNGIPSTFDVGSFGHYEATLNARQWPEHIRQWGGASAAEMNFWYGYDASGNILGIGDESPSGGTTEFRSLEYDGLDRLRTANGPWGNRQYQYDGVNNIVSYVGNKESASFIYNDGTNRLNVFGRQGMGDRTYSYNTRGEVTSDGLFSFTRNNAGQITAIPGVATYAYDGNGKRIKSVVNGRTEYSIYRKSGELIQFYDASAAARTDLLQLDGKTLAEIKRVGTVDTPTYLSVDLLGSPVVFSNANGQLIGRESYGPYGEKLKDVDNVVGYTGHAHDWETGLTYAQARYYDAAVGRFLSTDPLSFSGTAADAFNRYAYGNNNPYRFTDPTGMVGELAAIGCAVTAAAGCAPGAIVGAVADAVILGGSAAVAAWVISNVIEDASEDHPASGPEAADPDKGTTTLKPGPNAGESIPARGPDRSFNPEERGKINQNGDRDGCHTCGAKEPGTKSGNWVPDHQPPSATNSEGAP